MPQYAIPNTQYPLIVILGPTASGKTKLAVRLAALTDGEIISADSRQVYRGMDIGTGKDLDDYNLNGKKIPYHLIDIAEAGERYHVYAWQQDFKNALADIRRRGKQAILCGGTGLYIDAVLRGFSYTQVPVDSALRADLNRYGFEELTAMFRSVDGPYRNKADLSTKKRIIRAIEISRWLEENAIQPAAEALPHILFGLNPPVPERQQLIHERLLYRLENGLISEVEKLLQKQLGPADLEHYGLEYRFIGRFLQGEISYDELLEKLNVAIRQFAKRQMTYFRKMEKDGLMIHWLGNGISPEQQLDFIITKRDDFIRNL